MGEYMRRCKRIGEVAVMEVAYGDMEITSSGSSKRRKIDSPELLQSFPPNLQLENHYRSGANLPGDSISQTVSGTSDDVPSSLCSSIDLKEVVKDSFKTLDLKAESVETEISMFNDGGFSRATTPSSELCADLEEMDSSTSKRKPTPASSRSKSSASKIPPAVDIEEFFSAAEKFEQKRFAEKYNYDVVNDVPMEGRYQWVRLKP